ncbi:MAG: polysaccharide biosynthesis/export family protein [Gluconacetobacter sp.]|uniref:Polysaccharide export protein n=1 Tax=Gluconacetobacter dulcium TaxID=2729096 RepID=A0A7W4K0P0_9PROT|nr:polysaccharide biosynthesis/export family protein [Gluconacetobacter dulcium]MBB2198177.1 polysaccharide export protein [Gluconacetobacter dulcium]
MLAVTFLRRLPVVLLAVCFAGCVQHLDPKPHSARNFAPWTNDPVPYRLSPGDVVALQFTLNPELNENELSIAPDGTITAPLLGAVDAAGLSLVELKKNLQRRYRAYLRQASFDLLIHSYGAAQIYVGGEVKTQGIYPLKGATDAMQAVVTAGGAIDSAKLAQTIVIRRRGDGRPMMRTVDLRHYLNTADTRDRVMLQPGDLVYVPKTEIASFDIFIDQYLDKSVPFNKTFNYNMGSSVFY